MQLQRKERTLRAPAEPLGMSQQCCSMWTSYRKHLQLQQLFESTLMRVFAVQIGGGFIAILLSVDLEVLYFTKCFAFAPHLAYLLHLPCPYSTSCSASSAA